MYRHTDKGQRRSTSADTPMPSARDIRARRAILDTATELFFAHGYDAVSVDSIVAGVGGSKTNIYRQFGGKDGLLDALVECESGKLRKPLDDLDVLASPLREGLALIAKTYTSVIFDDRAVALHRLVIAQGKRFPKLAATFAKNGPEASVQRVAAIFSHWKGVGILCTERDPHILSRQFLELLKIRVHAQLLLGIPDAGSRKDKQMAITEGIETFLHGVQKMRSGTGMR